MNRDNEESASQITEMNNNRIYERNIPSSELQPYFSPRPTQTKYTKFMTDIPPVQSSVPLQQIPSYNPHTTFYPANKNAPWNGFANNIDVDSDMRNQFYALQSCPQATYVPTSESDLYTLSSFVHPAQSIVQTHPLLFNKQTFDLFNPNVTGMSNGTFNNHTRQDIKNSN